METKLLSKQKDEILAIEAQGGSEKALEILIQRYNYLATNKSFEYFIKGSENADLKQEAIIGLLRAVKDFDFEKKVPFTIFADICINRAVMTAIQKADRHKQNVLNTSIPLQVLVEENSYRLILADPADQLIENHYFEELYNIFVDKLTDLEKQVFHFHLMEKGYKETALALKISEKAVDNAIQRIRKKAHGLCLKQ